MVDVERPWERADRATWEASRRAGRRATGAFVALAVVIGVVALSLVALVAWAVAA